MSSPTSKTVYSEDAEAALQRLIESLDSRKNQMFDPTLLAMAEGFLSPTRSGGFGESLGIAAGRVRGAQEEEAKRATEEAKARFDIAQLKGQMASQKAQWADIVGGAPAPAGAPAAPGAPSAPSGAAPSAIPMGLSKDQYLRMALASNQDRMTAELGWDKYQREGSKQTEAGSWNLRTNEFTPTPSSERVSYPVFALVPPGKDGRPQEFMIPKDIALKANQAMEKNNVDEYKRLLSPYIFGFGAAPAGAPAAGAAGAPGAPGAPAGATAAQGAPGAPVRLESAEERKQRESKEEVEKITQSEMAKRNVKETSEFLDAGNSARATLPSLQRMEDIIKTTPGIEKVMGVLERPDVKAQIGSLVEEAVRVGNFAIGIPQIRKVLMNAGTPQNVIDKVSELGQLIAISQFEQRRGLGSGTSVSNFEQQMVNQMGPTFADNKDAFLRKLAFMREQANFRSKLASELRSRKMQFNEFEQTKEFQNMFDDYMKSQRAIVGEGTPTTAPAGPKEGQKATSASGKPIIFRNNRWEYE